MYIMLHPNLLRFYMKKTSPTSCPRSGFTLVEILVVIAVIAVMMSLVVGLSGTANASALDARAKTEIANLMIEIEAHKISEGTFPADWAAFNTWYTTKYAGTAYTITDGDPSGPIDPWGNSYLYTFDTNTPFVFYIGSFGPDGVVGDGGAPSTFGEGDDLTNRNGTLQ